MIDFTFTELKLNNYELFLLILVIAGILMIIGAKLYGTFLDYQFKKLADYERKNINRKAPKEVWKKSEPPHGPISKK